MRRASVLPPTEVHWESIRPKREPEPLGRLTHTREKLKRRAPSPFATLYFRVRFRSVADTPNGDEYDAPADRC